MSFCVTRDANLQQNALQFLCHTNPNDENAECFESTGGILSNLNYAWLVNGSRFVVVNTKNGVRVGSLDFGNALQDETAEILTVDEIQRHDGKPPLLAISLNCDTSGGIICIFDFIGSKIVRAIQVSKNITSIHVIDGGQDVFNLSGPLKNFDGILAVGTVGGDVYIVDICRQLCYEGFGTLQARDELNPCQIKVVTTQHLLDVENLKRNALRDESNLAIHLNAVLDNTTEHFVLKGPDGVDRVHVNKGEVLISALHYCPQLGSILVGYNFGAFQLWNLMCMELIYTSPICDDHVPISKFAIQEPADDPRAFCYVWAVYSSDDLNSSLLPYLVMYAICFESKEYHETYGILYENFQYCAVRFHMELGFNNQSIVSPKGGKCLRLQSMVHKNSLVNSEVCSSDVTEDVSSLCVVIWKAAGENSILTYMAVFDLNQWYKAQMPNTPNSDDCGSYMITLCVTDLVETVAERTQVFDVAIHKKTLQQFIGTQKLEEHYYPSSLSFDTCCLLENKSLTIQYQGIQKALLYQLQSAGPLCLIRPTEIYQEIVSLGLTPLFVEVSTTLPVTLNMQREIILNVALEQQLISWLCKCASEWANGSFSSAGCSLELLTAWAFQRGIVLKNNCDNLCVPLFDYSGIKLDTNTTNILNNCIRQIKNISYFYSFVDKNLSVYVTNTDLVSEQCRVLKMVELYFDSLQWLFNVGLLPEYSPSSITGIISDDRIRAPYPAEELAEYYSKRRSELLLAAKQRFYSKSCVLFIDNLINIECGGDKLGKDWKNDGGDGFYPPISLQALLRTYLTDGIEVSNKHAVVIYLFLDLAMVLDPQKYASVITHLIKFPAVFKVTPSLIKITQAFWQLDHGDFSTAMEQLLDPMVNQEDLKDWHHKVALKSLLIQDQHNSALLYMHVRKPPIVDDEDVLCALSLFISNNMLDEAFYLQKHYKNCSSSQKFIKHLFSECSRQGLLSNILYRNLSDEEEELFLRYLDEVKHPDAADLKITYFMQRTYYIEAFKTYENCKVDPNKKGLVGRSNSKARDQIIDTYRKVLPTVSYKFIESCTKEPTQTAWKEVSRPEPMSVFVHQTDEKTEYKSSIIFAALAKAKQTFNGGVQNVSLLLNSVTEQIPFLRTPTRLPSRKRSSVNVIVPTMVNEEEDGPSPKKKPRMSPKSASILSQSSIKLDSSLLTTPIVKRKQRQHVSPVERRRELTTTPTSILKVKHSFSEDSRRTTLPNLTTESLTTPVSSEKYPSSLSGRKSISRTSTVRFDVPKSSTSSAESSYSVNRLSSPRERDFRTSVSNQSISFANSSKSFSRSLTPKNVSDSDDVFYSPNSSLNNIEDLPKDEEVSSGQVIASSTVYKENSDGGSEKEDSKMEEGSLRISPKRRAISEAKLVKLVDYDPSTSSRDDSESMKGSPRARKSYKKLSNEIIPVRSSPRLNRSRELPSSEVLPISDEEFVTKNNEHEANSSKIHTERTEDVPSEDKQPFAVGTLNIKPRKSLSRKVLEYNAFSRLASDAESAETSLTSGFHAERKDVSAVANKENTRFSYTKIEYSDVYTKESSTPEKIIEKHSVNKICTSIRESVLDSEHDSSSSGSIESPKNLLETSLSDSFMDELMDNLRQRESRVHQDQLRAETTVEKQESPRSKDETPAKITRRSSRRLSAERTIPAAETSRASTLNKENMDSTQKIPRRLSEERILSTDDSQSSSQTEKDKVEVLKFTPKLRTRKSLSRQVLESNTFARLAQEYVAANEVSDVKESSSVSDEKADSVPVVSEVKTSSSESREIVSLVADPTCVLESPKVTESPDSSLTDSLLELISFEQPSTQKVVPEHSASSSQIEEKKRDEDLTVTEEKKNEASVVQVDITDDLDPDTEEKTLAEKREESCAIVLDQAEITDDLECKEEMVDVDQSGSDKAEENQPQSRCTPLQNVAMSNAEEEAQNEQDYSMVYDDLSDGDSSNQNDPEMNVFEISDDLSLNDALIEEGEAPFTGSEITSDLDNMMEESPLPTVFERNIAISNNSESNDSSEEVSETGDDNQELRIDSNPASEVVELDSSSSEDEESESRSSKATSESQQSKSSGTEKSTTTSTEEDTSSAESNSQEIANEENTSDSNDTEDANPQDDTSDDQSEKSEGAQAASDTLEIPLGGSPGKKIRLQIETTLHRKYKPMKHENQKNKEKESEDLQMDSDDSTQDEIVELPILEIELSSTGPAQTLEMKIEEDVNQTETHEEERYVTKETDELQTETESPMEHELEADADEATIEHPEEAETQADLKEPVEEKSLDLQTEKPPPEESPVDESALRVATGESSGQIENSLAEKTPVDEVVVDETRAQKDTKQSLLKKCLVDLSQDKIKIDSGAPNERKSVEMQTGKSLLQEPTANSSEDELVIDTGVPTDKKSVQMQTGKSLLCDTTLNQPEDKEEVEDSRADLEEQVEKQSVELQTGKSLMDIGKDEDASSDKKSEVLEMVVPARRITRRTSRLLEENGSESGSVDLDTPKKKEVAQKDVEASSSQEGSIRKRSHRLRLSVDPASPSEINLKNKFPQTTSTSKKVKTYSRKRTRSVDTPSLVLSETDEVKPGTSKETDTKPARRKLRSASVDIVDIDDPNKEEELEKEEDAKKKRPASVHLPVIEEARRSRRKPAKTVKRNLVENYASTRRLTRRQANMLETSLKNADELEEVDTLGRIELLDQPNFEGSPDPDEKKIYETSPSSSELSLSVSVRGGAAKRTNRSNSNVSDSSTHVSSGVSTPKRTRSVVAHADSPIPSESRRRLRSASVVDVPEVVEGTRRTRKASADDDNESLASKASSVMSTRSNQSNTSNKSDGNSTNRRKRKVAPKKRLPKIKEEN